MAANDGPAHDGPACDGPARGSGLPGSGLRAASYNIHRCFGTDRKYFPERIAEVLKSLDADLLALQEVDMRLLVDGRPQLEFFADTLGMTALAGAAMNDYRGHFGNALLTRLPVQGVRRIDLSVRRFEPRGAIDADLLLDGAPLRAIATHLGLNAAERRLQVRHLLHALDAAGPPERAGTPCLVMGDCNEWKPLHGALKALDRRFGDSLLLRTFPSRFPLLPLDRIWAWPHPGIRRVRAVSTSLTRLASDHLPIRADVFWDAPLLTGTSPSAADRAKG